MSVCDQLIKREENDPFLKHMIMDEKWIVYNNVSRKRSWSRRGKAPERQAKTEIHQKKVMLSMWWDWKGPVFYELLSKKKTINSDVYCEQLQKLSDAIAQKRLELINRKGGISPRQCETTHKFDHSAKIVATWLGCVTTSYRSCRSCTRLPSLSLLAKLLEW